MPEHARRFSAALYDQQNEDHVADWGGDELFTRMPRPRAVDTAPAPRFRPSLALVDPPEDRRRAPAGAQWSGARDRRRSLSAAEAMRERAERLGLAVLEGARPEPRTAADGWDAAAWQAATREHADGAPPIAAEPRAAEGSARGDATAADRNPTEREWDGSFDVDRAPNGRRTTVITGRPDGVPRPLSPAAAQRRRPARTPAEWVGPRPERIMAWAFVLGLLLIMIAISTADAATP